jgi:hypothetical protein
MAAKRHRKHKKMIKFIIPISYSQKKRKADFLRFPPVSTIQALYKFSQIFVHIRRKLRHFIARKYLLVLFIGRFHTIRRPFGGPTVEIITIGRNISLRREQRRKGYNLEIISKSSEIID